MTENTKIEIVSVDPDIFISKHIDKLNCASAIVYFMIAVYEATSVQDAIMKYRVQEHVGGGYALHSHCVQMPLVQRICLEMNLEVIPREGVPVCSDAVCSALTRTALEFAIRLAERIDIRL